LVIAPALAELANIWVKNTKTSLLPHDFLQHNQISYLIENSPLGKTLSGYFFVYNFGIQFVNSITKANNY